MVVSRTGNVPRLIGFAVVFSALAGGCQTYDRASVAQTFAPGFDPVVASAPHDGYYYLFRGGGKSPVAQVFLTSGQAIGFRVDATDSSGKSVGPVGSTSAVAGSFAVTIDTATAYEWRYVPNKGKPQASSSR